MSTYNTLRAVMTCPHCGTQAATDVELRFGDTRSMDSFALGDNYKWLTGKAPQRGGRPADGNLDAEGYTECPACRRDYFVIVTIRENRLDAANPDMGRPGYIAKENAQ